MRPLIRLATPLLLALSLALSACTRPLSAPERGFLETLAPGALDAEALRIHPGLAAVEYTAPVPPRVTCQSRLYPPLPGPTARGTSPAMSLWNTVLIRSDWHQPSMVGDWPRVLDLPRAMILLHEALHVWQWQQRARTGYTPWRAFSEHVGNPDPYLFDPDTRAEFRSFGYEQQGAILEEYLCCRLLAPDAERTARLHAMIARELPLAPLSQPLTERVLLPWRGVELAGICD